MSWFDASGITSLAKSALKEAQKTIDKALDIQQEELEASKQNAPECPPTGDFFSTWGLSSSNSLDNDRPPPPIITQSPSKAMSQSLWGSFTGSFFDPGEKVSKSNSLDKITEASKSDESRSDSDKHSNQKSTHSVMLRRYSDRQSVPLNRLSLVSSESGKNSSESIEVLGSQSLKTTPDSEGVSVNNSISTSSSLGLKLTSDSVEVIADSLNSPSSIELLGFTHTATGSEFNSPSTPSIENASMSKSDSRNTDDDIKVITNHLNVFNNEDEEASVGDDTVSYNSLSEFTSPTVLDATQALKVDTFAGRKVIPQSSNEMVDSFGSDITGSVNNSSDDPPITRAPSRSIVPQFLPGLPGSVQCLDKSTPPAATDSNITNCDTVNQSCKSSFQSLVTESTSSNEGTWSDNTINPDDSIILEKNSDFLTKIPVISEKLSGCSLKNNIQDIMNDKLSDKISDSSSYCKVNEDLEDMHIAWKDGAHSSSSQSYEEIDKGSSIDNIASECISHVQFDHREPNSPISSDGRSVDIVKLGSEQTSGHTSGDDLETTTSSDIEIIPSPNGDYNGAYCRQSPAKVSGKFSKQHSGNVVDLVLGKALVSKIRGHTRELSAASNQSNTSDDSHSSEVDRLMRRLAEMTEILESREAKLIEISRNNVELNEMNSDLKIQIDNLSKQDTADVTMITEEYTQRLSALEKKFQQAIREKDGLRKQVETYKQEAVSRLAAGDIENAIGERDETIRELREEGEKLSKQQLHHSTIIKRLRAKEKENEQVIKTLRDKVADQAQELDRLKRSVSAKEAVECSQIETVYKLTTANKKLDTEISEVKGQLDDTTQKYETVKCSLDAAKKEMAELLKSCGDQVKNQETIELLEKEKSAIEMENEQLLHQLEELRNRMRQDEQRMMSRETALRNEVSRQMARAEEAESTLLMSKNDIGGVSTGDGVTTDGAVLLAQLAALQENSLERERRFQTTERRLQQALSDAQLKLNKTNEANQLLKDECQMLQTKVSSIEINLSQTSQKFENCMSACEEHMHQLNITMENSKKLKQEFDNQKQYTTETIDKLNNELKNMDLLLSAERVSHEAEKRRNAILQEQLKDTIASTDQASGSSLLLARLVGSNENTGVMNPDKPVTSNAERATNNSPHGSTGRDSLASESLGSGVWQNDDTESIIGSIGGIIGENITINSDGSICTLELLQAALQRREGELRAARKASRRSYAQRTALARELAIHAAELDNMQNLQHQYDALLQMYGEKEEQLQEVRLDLQDVKDMYKMQLDEILMLKRQVNEFNNKQQQ